ncbi:MAG: hypothetical protein NWF04_09575 [Candidatus Bathyarchaeota archaeon]|nr:hypothetical protein [Candidatus Bathyarchaeota archaeon]
MSFNLDKGTLRFSKLFAVAAALLLVSSIFAAVSPATAQDGADTYLALAVSPDPVGTGQTLYVVFWLTVYPPTAAGAGGDRWRGMEVTIWKPDGSMETRGPFTSDPVGGAYLLYTPDQVGTYSFQASFPGQTLEAGENPQPAGLPYVGTYFKPSTSDVVDVTVQSTPVESWPQADLPSGYWSRPISADLRSWSQISGNWLLGRSNYATAGRIYNPYTTAPETSHVVWTKELSFGGLIGGDFGEQSYYSGITYENKFSPPVIMQGKLYYNIYPATPPLSGFVCVDLRTGETVWTQNGTGPSPVTLSLAGYGQNEPRLAEGYPKLSMGQIFNPDTPNQHGGIPYLWTSGGTGATARWDAYDAVTGAWLYSLSNVSGYTSTFGPKGEILGYLLDGAGHWIAMWNSSKVEGLWGGTQGTEAWQWRPPINEILDANTGIEWNTTVAGVSGPSALSIQLVDPETNIVIAAGAEAPFIGFGDKVWFVAYDGVTGAQLWTQEVDIPFSATLGGPAYGANLVAGEGVFAMYEKETMRWHIFDIHSGELLRTTDPRPGSDWGKYVEGGNIAYGKLYSAGYDGLMCCWDLNSGDFLWSYSAGVSGEETIYGTWPLVTGPIADGKIYTYTNEHSPGSPFYRGAKLHCINADNGDGLWSLTGWWGHNHYSTGTLAIADGYLVAPNYYDGQIYCFGKGQTVTTVLASPKVASKDSAVLIEGTVLDDSPGAKGTPAIADAYMDAWMEYLYQQKACPENLDGVQVKLTAVDSNGNSQDIATVTSDAYGKFQTMWAPPAEDAYSIVATFEGSGSYFGSYDETALGVCTATGQLADNSDAGFMDLPTGAWVLGIIVIILLLVAVAMLLLKRNS